MYTILYELVPYVRGKHFKSQILSKIFLREKILLFFLKFTQSQYFGQRSFSRKKKKKKKM